MKASKANAVAAAFVRMCVARVGLTALQHAAQSQALPGRLVEE